MTLHTWASLLFDVGGTENFNRTSSQLLESTLDVSQVIFSPVKDAGVISRRQVEVVAFALHMS